jgi:hypothetical protein
MRRSLCDLSFSRDNGCQFDVSQNLRVLIMKERAISARKTTLTLTIDAFKDLERWAKMNLTSLSAETTRAVRERAAAERRERTSGAAA